MIAVNKLKGKIAEQGMNMTTFAKSIDLDYSACIGVWRGRYLLRCRMLKR